jgi:hypothetical protein
MNDVFFWGAKLVVKNMTPNLLPIILVGLKKKASYKWTAGFYQSRKRLLGKPMKKKLLLKIKKNFTSKKNVESRHGTKFSSGLQAGPSKKQQIKRIMNEEFSFDKKSFL